MCSSINGSSSTNGKKQGYSWEDIYCCTHIFSAYYLMEITHIEWYFEHINVFQNMYIDQEFHHMLIVFPKLVCFILCMYHCMTQTILSHALLFSYKLFWFKFTQILVLSQMHIPFACKQGALNSLGLMVSHYTTTSLLMTSGKHPHSLFTILLKQLLCSLTLTILDMPLSNFITNHVEPFLQVIQQFPNGIVISTQTTGRIRIPI